MRKGRLSPSFPNCSTSSETARSSTRRGSPEKFDIHLEFAADAATPKFLPGGDLARFAGAASDPTGASIFPAIQQLGLKLEPTKGPREFLVIDHVERPTEN
jgi:uncharacterized protein (TIGR03435 family)